MALDFIKGERDPTVTKRLSIHCYLFLLSKQCHSLYQQTSGERTLEKVITFLLTSYKAYKETNSWNKTSFNVHSAFFWLKHKPLLVSICQRCHYIHSQFLLHTPRLKIIAPKSKTSTHGEGWKKNEKERERERARTIKIKNEMIPILQDMKTSSKAAFFYSLP